MPVETIVVALDDRFGIARLPMVLHRAGARVTLLGNTRSSIGWSRFVDRRIRCDRNRLIPALKKLLVEFGDVVPWVILSDEASVSELANCRGESWLDPIFPVDHRGPMVDAIVRKTAFMTEAAHSELPIPDFYVCRSTTDAKTNCDLLGYPCILKRDIDAAGQGIMRIETAAEAIEAYLALCDSGHVLAQRLLPGNVGTTDILFYHGRPVCWSSWYTRRTWLNEFGPSCVRQPVADPELDAIVKELGQFTGFHGFCGVDWIRDPRSGRFTAIEFNGRVTPGSHLGYYNGVDFSVALRELFLGMLRVQKPSPVDLTAQVHLFPQDLRHCFSSDIFGLFHWLPGMAHHDTPWNDPALLLRLGVDLVHGMRHRFKSMIPIKHRADRTHSLLPA